MTLILCLLACDYAFGITWWSLSHNHYDKGTNVVEIFSTEKEKEREEKSEFGGRVFRVGIAWIPASWAEECERGTSAAMTARVTRPASTQHINTHWDRHLMHTCEGATKKKLGVWLVMVISWDDLRVSKELQILVYYSAKCSGNSFLNVTIINVTTRLWSLFHTYDYICTHWFPKRPPETHGWWSPYWKCWAQTNSFTTGL